MRILHYSCEIILDRDCSEFLNKVTRLEKKSFTTVKKVSEFYKISWELSYLS